MLVKLISSPNINWSEWVNLVYQLTGKSPVKLLDFENRNKQDYFSFIASLGYLYDNLSPDESIKQLHLLKHLSFSFLIECGFELSIIILKDTELAIENHKSLCLISGNLLNWHDAIISMTQEYRSFESRLLFDTLYLYFREIGIFNKKIELSDKTFVVE